MMGGAVVCALAILLLALPVPADAADPDEVLLIPVPGTADLSAGLKPASQGITVLSRMTIRKGDSLWRIARRTLGRGDYYPLLLAFNAIQNPDLIYEGRSLLLPAGTLDRHPALASRLSGKTATIVFPPPAASTQVEPKAAPPDNEDKAEVQAIVELASKGDCAGVIAAADRYLARHPRSSRRAAVLLHQAECYRLMLPSGQ